MIILFATTGLLFIASAFTLRTIFLIALAVFMLCASAVFSVVIGECSDTDN